MNPKIKTANNALNAYAAQAQPAKPTHGGTASMLTLAALLILIKSKKIMEKSIENLSRLSNDELILALGEEIQSQRIGLNEKESPYETGNKAFKKYLELLKSDICEHEQLKKFMLTDKVFDEVQIAAGICDVIVGYFSGVTLVSLSILIARRGLINYCNQDNNE